MSGSIVADCFPPSPLMAERDYQRLAQFVHARTGIKMPPSKKSFLEGRLRRQLNARGFATFDEYCHYLFERGGLAEEEEALVNCITTNKTDFFREPHHFDFLTREALPLLAPQVSGRALRLWSAGCSSGAEPFTLAMLCQDFAEITPGFRFEITASDISTGVLREAARAIYPHAMIEPVPLETRKRYLLRDVERDEVRIAPELRRLVSFRHINLMDRDYRLGQPMDVVFCRNLLIYFDKPTQRAVLARLCASLRVGGYLVLGHSESVAGLSLPLRPANATTVYVREDRA